jgi:hypothetical protein
MNPTLPIRHHIAISFLFYVSSYTYSIAQQKPSLSYSSFAFVNKTEGFFLGHDLTANKNNHQLTLRYNYEASDHLSGYYGYVFAKKTGKYEINLTPMAGLLTNFNKSGGSIGFQGYVYSDTLNVYAYSQAYQITYFKKGFVPLFYNWTEVGYEIGKKNIAGVSCILSREQRTSYFAAGPFFYKQFSTHLFASAYALIVGNDPSLLVGATWQF